MQVDIPALMAALTAPPTPYTDKVCASLADLCMTDAEIEAEAVREAIDTALTPTVDAFDEFLDDDRRMTERNDMVRDLVRERYEDGGEQ